MAEIKPFRGILYNKKKVNIADVVTPPYDVISQSMQNRFYQRDKYNIIRLVLGKKEKSDNPRNNRYTRAKKLFDKCLNDRIFIKDRKPAIYIYTQQYLHKGKKKTRIGFIALMKIEDPKESGVLPHEYTLDKPKIDRLNLILKTKANLSPIFSLFQDEANRINKILKRFIKFKSPLFTIETEGVTHKFWRMDNKDALKRIKAYMRDKKIFIADGHHRYEVALSYRNMMRKRHSCFKKSMDYVMMYFSNLSEKGNLTILSTQRVVRNIKKFDEGKLRLKLARYFRLRNARSLEDISRHLEKTKRNEHVFGMYTGKGRFYLLVLRIALMRPDVSILHDLIIDKILCIRNRESDIKYVRNEKDAVSLVDKGDYKVAFFLRPTSVLDMKSVAEKGEMLPQKSTYFYPKLLTGLVINKF